MLNDAQVRQSVSYVVTPLVAATWRLRPGGRRPVDLEAADFARMAFIEKLQWSQIVERVIGDYATYGFSLNELTDDVRPIDRQRFPLHPGGGYGIVPTGIHEISARTLYRWNQAKGATTQLASIQQYVPGSDAEAAGYRTIPADRIIRWTYKQEGANFEGFPVLRSAFAAWKLKLAFMTIWAIKHERLGVGTPVAIAAAEVSDADLAAAEKALKEMRANARGYIVLPNGWTFEWKGATASDGTNLELALQICNIEIAMNVAAGFMLLGLTGAAGSYALGSTQQGQYHLAEVSHARFLEAGLNVGADGWGAIERIVRLNYGEDVALPTLEARNLPTTDWAQRLPQLINAVNAGLITADDALEDELREILEVNPRDPSTARLSKTLPPTPGDVQPDAEEPPEAPAEAPSEETLSEQGTEP
jgi:hypothetical protein